MPAIAAIWLLLLASPAQTLHSGATGPGVSALQSVLAEEGYSPGSVDGNYGPMTTAAVRSFESASGLPSDGEASAPVLDALLQKFASSVPVLSEGATGAQVVVLQALLNADGAKLTTDGNFGPLTLTAVEALQSSRGLTSDGVVGPLTWQGVFSRIYPVTSGDTMSLIAGRLGVSTALILRANGGSQNIFAGQSIVVPYAGWSVTTTPNLSGTLSSASNSAPAQSQGSSAGGPTTATSGSANPGSSSTGSTTAKTPPPRTKPKTPKGFIPASALALWGNAGTPDIYVIALPTSADTLRAAIAVAAGGHVGLAIPTALWSLAPAADRNMLATSSLRDVETLHPRWVVWLGRLSARNFEKIVELGSKVLLAPPVTGDALSVAAQASGGRPLLVQLQPGQTALLERLLQNLRTAGYNPLLLGQY